MARSTFLASAALTALLAGCANAPIRTAVPQGLAFECEPGGSAFVHYGDGGYLPEATARTTNADGGAVQAPRSSAQLRYGGESHAMVAEWAEQGLRYRSVEPSGGAYVIWAQRGEEGVIGRRPALVASAADEPEGERIASCVRSGREPGAARDG